MTRWSNAVVVIAILATSCSSGPVSLDVSRASTISGDDRTFDLAVDACTTPGVTVKVEELDEEVVVSVSGTTREGDCGLNLVIELEQNLGERVLIDSHDSEPIPVAADG